MALIPLLVNELLDEARRPSLTDLYDQNFGLGLCDDVFPVVHRVRNSILPSSLRSGYLRPWRLLAENDSGVSSVKSNENEFSVKLDVNHFKPEELKVKLDDKGYVVIEGEHEERSDQHGFVSRQFRRRYKLPNDTLPDTLKSNLSTDGVLSITAAKKVSSTAKLDYWRINY
ncbi:unnamed protein product [Nesidiocoris tenuis]|uniref:SHSP domain-containing protein n=1 Tax=Nesidiocoris tenuis TaxID=355587 RepID=A0A6H5H9L6_9HEMI|nr:unnamed protein product [Nesidiocoris tenuis]